MKFSTRATYGLKALLHLANAHGQRAVSVSQIAREEAISAPYLEQILHFLKKKGWIKSLRGPAGGYVLSRKPSEIAVGKVLRDLEGGRQTSFVPAEDASGAKKNTAALAAHLFWNKFFKHYTQFLDSQSLKELIDEARRIERREGGASGRMHFSI